MAHVARELLKKELVNLMKDESCGFSVGLEDDSDFFTWRVVFEGPSDSLYEGGIFTAILKFPGDFPNNPPEMRQGAQCLRPKCGIPTSIPTGECASRFCTRLARTGSTTRRLRMSAGAPSLGCTASSSA
ncbi:unnamed protein product [Effrenium voratum]|nr:unnamed protein product [Effrenium voratum]